MEEDFTSFPQPIPEEPPSVIVPPENFGFTVDELPGITLFSTPIEVEPGVFLIATGLPPEEVDITTPNNISAAQTTKADQLQPGGGLGLNLTGAGVTVGVWDVGDVRETHQEFGGRVRLGADRVSVDSEALDYHNHATHVAGTIGAAGNPVGTARGMAPGVEIISYDSVNDLSEISLDTNGLVLSNHSYGPYAGWTTSFPWPKSFITGTVDTWWGDLSTQNSLGNSESVIFGQYDSVSTQFRDASDWDNMLYNDPNLLSIWAAGNDRNEPFTDAQENGTYVTYISSASTPGYYYLDGSKFQLTNTIKSPPPPPDGSSNNGYDTIGGQRGQAAKNTLVVGAVDDSGNISSFSGFGPTDDGRIKPDVVGNGVNVYSTAAFKKNSFGQDILDVSNNPIASNNDYYVSNGTSMAAPNVTGTAALLYEHFKNLNGSFPKSATGKGLLIHTANDLGNPGPDYQYGWGVVDGAKAANFITNEADTTNQEDQLIEAAYSGTEQTFNIQVDSANTPLKATLVWTDPAPTSLPSSGLDDPTSVLVNDLDLWITDANGTVYHPWTLDPNNPSANAVQTQPNNLDNVEQVLFNAPAAGTYTVHVGGTLENPYPVQDFSLLISSHECSGNVVSISSPVPDSPPAIPVVVGLNNDATNIINGEDVYLYTNGVDNGSPTSTATANKYFSLSGADNIAGLATNDYLFGNKNNDVIDGQAGDDVIFGGQENDMLSGGDGNDTLLGDAGADMLTGGTGSDTFVLQQPGSATPETADVILDFEDGVDRLMLPSGITDFSQLNFTDICLEIDGNMAHSTAIEFNGSFLALVQGISPSQLDANDFVPEDMSFL